MFYTPPPGKERPSSRQKDPAALPPQEEDKAGRQQASAKEQAPVTAPTYWVCDPAKGKWPEEFQPKRKKKKPVEQVELWEIGTSGAYPTPRQKRSPPGQRNASYGDPLHGRRGPRPLRSISFQRKDPRRGRRYV
jgi:hypothetical protein